VAIRRVMGSGFQPELGRRPKAGLFQGLWSACWNCCLIRSREKDYERLMRVSVRTSRKFVQEMARRGLIQTEREGMWGAILETGSLSFLVLPALNP
jgi:hypothetical protein